MDEKEEQKTSQQKISIQQQAPNMKKFKKISNKEIYRLIAFEFREQGNGIKLSILSDMVANLFYPFDEVGEPKKKFKSLVEEAFRAYCMKEEISEGDFVAAMDSVEKFMSEEQTERFLLKIFKRHDKDKDDMLNREEFTSLLKNYNNKNLTQKEIDNIFESMLVGDQKGVDYKTFLKHST